MCDCQSYNAIDHTGPIEPVVLDFAKYFPDTGKPKVSVDSCISEAIEELWREGVRTLHSCCGHNGLFGGPSVILDVADDFPVAARILREDGRRWRIYADLK